jgi:BolA protein
MAEPSQWQFGRWARMISYPLSEPLESRFMSIYQQLEQSLREAFDPLHLEIENESHKHGGGQARPDKVRESHFRVVLVSQAFDGKRPLQRHQMVYEALGDLVGRGNIHALALHTYAPSQWASMDGAPESPPCPKS